MANGKEWTTPEIKYLRQHYPAGTPAHEIAGHLGRSIGSIRRKAYLLRLTHPNHSSQQSIANFEAMHGKPLAEIAREYRDRRLSRTELAGDIGIIYQNLRKFLPDDLWQSWPFMTIGRIDANKVRQRAA